MSTLSNAELEVRIMSILDRVEQGQRIEDSTIELKSNFINPVKAAEVLAGHANAALGEQLLWLIGVDEKQGAVVGIDQTELKDWLSKVNKTFDEIAPTLIKDLVVPRNGLSVLALVFETDRAPYVVKHDKKPQHWVPWRYGADTQPARRSELLRILLPTIKAPKIEVLQGFFTGAAHAEFSIFKVAINLYLIPATSSEVVTIPPHKIKGILVLPKGDYRIESESTVRIEAPEITEQTTRLNEKISTPRRQSTYVSQELIFCDTPKPVRLHQAFCTKEVPIEWGPAFIDVSYKELQAKYELELTLDQLDH
mgnify:CR=1 FL=1